MILEEKVIISDKLNSKLYNSDNKLIPEVRDKILLIVEEFRKSLEVPINILDIHLVGSNASYNYTDNSDIDVHLIVNFNSMVYIQDELLKAYYNAERSNFNKKYDISIKDLEVELYIEDIKTTTISNGVYSVIQDQWIKFPDPIDENSIEDIDQLIVNEKIKEIDELLDTNNLINIESMLDKLYLDRKLSFINKSEYSDGNLLFKELRDQGYINRIKNKIDELKTRELSLEKTINESLSKYIKSNMKILN